MLEVKGSSIFKAEVVSSVPRFEGRLLDPELTTPAWKNPSVNQAAVQMHRIRMSSKRVKSIFPFPSCSPV